MMLSTRYEKAPLEPCTSTRYFFAHNPQRHCPAASQGRRAPAIRPRRQLRPYDSGQDQQP